MKYVLLAYITVKETASYHTTETLFLWFSGARTLEISEKSNGDGIFKALAEMDCIPGLPLCMKLESVK